MKAFHAFFSDYNGMKLGFDNLRNVCKHMETE